MKKVLLASALFLALGTLPLSANAGSFTFTPYDTGGTRSDVFDLDHNYLYLWAIAATDNLKNALANGEVITSATIRIDDIYNWDNNSYALKFYLLDNVKKGDNLEQVDIISISDNQSIYNEIPKYLNYKFTAITELEKVIYNKTTGPTPTPIPGPNGTPIDYTYTFDSQELLSLSTYLDSANKWGSTSYNSTFGLGIDPDCHFYNKGISLNIVTSPVPEPTTTFLMGIGLTGLVAARRRKRA